MRRTLPMARAAAAALALALCPACRAQDPTGSPQAPGRSRQHHLAGVTLHTVEVGTGRPPVRLVLHGGPGLDHTYLRPWLDPLAARGTLVYVDLRGHGRSSAPPDAEGYTIAAAADDLAALVRARHRGAVDVVAHDFGAAVAVALAARHPEVVGHLVLVAPLRDAGQVRAMGRRSREVLGARGWQAVTALTTPQGTLRDPRTLPLLLRRLGGMWWHTPPSDAIIDGMTRRMVYRADADASFLVEALRWDARLLARDVRAPTLVVSGDDDRSYPPAESRALADALPHGRFVVVRAAGHLPFVEATGDFLRVVGGFLPGT